MEHQPAFCFQMLRLTYSSVRGYAKKVGAAGGATGGAPSMQSQRIKHAVETNPEKLATYCCGSNIKQTGEDVKLGADEDYPEWLWKMHLGPPLEPNELSQDTEEYWARVQQVSFLIGRSVEQIMECVNCVLVE